MATTAKPILATVELGPNYVFHLVALARAGFSSGYADRYRSSVRPGDLAVLEGCRSRLAWADGLRGDLTSPAVFLPAYLGLDAADAFMEYFDLLAEALSRCAPGPAHPCRADAVPFLERYAGPLAKLADWTEAVDRDWLARFQDPQGLARAVREIGAIFAGNFGAYEAEVWREERPGLEAAAKELNAFLAGHDFIGQWERLSGISFRAERYEIVLVRAIENGPNANSLSYDRNVFYSGSDPAWLRQFISHETGTHILIGVLFDYFKARAAEDGSPPDPETWGVIYRAYENLARFYNAMVLGASDLYRMGSDYRDSEFRAIYERLWAEDPTLGPREMLDRAVRAISGRETGE